MIDQNTIIGTAYQTMKADTGKPLTIQYLKDIIVTPSRMAKYDNQLFHCSIANGKTVKFIEAYDKVNKQFNSLQVDIDDGNPSKEQIINHCKHAGIPNFLIYSTARANREGYGNRWRIVIRLSHSIGCYEWQMLQRVLVECFRGDKTATRLNQGYYAPSNSDGGYYESHIEDGLPLDYGNLPIVLKSSLDKLEAEELAKDEVAKNAPLKPRKVTKDNSIIKMANDAYPIESVLRNNGHELIGRKWLDPDSTTGMPGGSVKDGKFYTNHGCSIFNDKQAHDSFDLQVYYRFNSDIKEAIKQLANELDPDGQEKSRNDWRDRESAKSKENSGIPTPAPASKVPLQGILGGRPNALREVTLIQGCTVQPEHIIWLWVGWFPLGKLIILAGQPGTGKTTLILAIAAIVTVGGSLPDGTKAEIGSVVIWSGEDGVADTLVPRLIAMGADMTKVFFVAGKGKVQFDPSQDLPQLAEMIKAVPDVKMVVVDPVVSAISGDSHKNAEVRKSLQPLVDLGVDTGACIVGISHFNKSGGNTSNPLDLISGSIAFAAVARVVLGAAKLVEPDPEHGHSRVFCRIKSNIGPDQDGIVVPLVKTKRCEV